MAEELRHIAQICDTRANLQTSLDVKQIAIESDNSENFVYKDDDGIYHMVANIGEAASFLNVTTRNLTVSTGYTLTLADITPGHILFGGAGGVVSGEANLFWNAANNRLGIGTATPGDVLDIRGSHIHTTGSLAHGMTAGLPTNAYFKVTDLGGAVVGGTYMVMAASGDNNGGKIVGVNGSATPTAAALIIAGSRYNGSSSFTSFANATDKVIKFQNHTTDLITILANATIEFATGTTRTIRVAQAASGAGNHLNILGGAGASGANGGNVYIDGGAKGAGSELINGSVIIGEVSTSSILCKVGVYAPSLSAINSGGLTLADDSGAIGVFIKDGGFVGIGNNNPSSALDVNGTIRARGGNSTAATTASQLLLSYTGGKYSHGIRTNHDSSSSAGNTMRFYLWQYGVDAEDVAAGTLEMLTIRGNNSVEINGSVSLFNGATRTINIQRAASGGGDSLIVEAGTGSLGGNYRGGHLYLRPGAGQGEGHDGDVIIGTATNAYNKIDLLNDTYANNIHARTVAGLTLRDSAGIAGVLVKNGGSLQFPYYTSAGLLACNIAGDIFSIATATLNGQLTHAGLSGTHNLTTDIDHNRLTNTHNLTNNIDHGSISGLADDDHTMYFRADGTREMAGNIVFDKAIDTYVIAPELRGSTEDNGVNLTIAAGRSSEMGTYVGGTLQLSGGQKSTSMNGYGGGPVKIDGGQGDQLAHDGIVIIGEAHCSSFQVCTSAVQRFSLDAAGAFYGRFGVASGDRMKITADSANTIIRAQSNNNIQFVDTNGNGLTVLHGGKVSFDSWVSFPASVKIYTYTRVLSADDRTANQYDFTITNPGSNVPLSMLCSGIDETTNYEYSNTDSNGSGFWLRPARIGSGSVRVSLGASWAAGDTIRLTVIGFE